MLYRSKSNRVIAGVCGGIAHHAKVKPAGIRVLFAILTLMYGMGIVIYLIAWLILSSE